VQAGAAGLRDRAACRGGMAHVRSRDLARHFNPIGGSSRGTSPTSRERRAAPGHPPSALETLRSVNGRFYRDLGADPARSGSNTIWRLVTEGPGWRSRRSGRGRGTAAGPIGEPWVSPPTTIGSADNLNELLHGIGARGCTSPPSRAAAFADWPDSDLFTEATRRHRGPGDVRAGLAAEIPRHLGAAGRFDPGQVRGDRHGHGLGPVRDPHASRADAPPNAVWTEITRRYFRIRRTRSCPVGGARPARQPARPTC